MKSSWHGSKSTTSRKNPKSPVRETPGSSEFPGYFDLGCVVPGQGLCGAGWVYDLSRGRGGPVVEVEQVVEGFVVGAEVGGDAAGFGSSAGGGVDLNPPGFAGDSVSWEGWGHVEKIWELPEGAAGPCCSDGGGGSVGACFGVGGH